MPKVWERSANDYSILVWQSTEPMEMLLKEAALNEADTRRWESFISLSRKREWLTVRLALKSLYSGKIPSTITYDANGKPVLPDKVLSISHSQEWIALMAAEKNRVGIDIEVVDSRIEKLSKKFLSKEENEYADSQHRMEKLHIMWGAKEVLFKIHGIGNVQFSTDLFVHPFNFNGSGEIRASILKKGFEKDFTIHYLKANNYMLAWSIENT